MTFGWEKWERLFIREEAMQEKYLVEDIGFPEMASGKRRGRRWQTRMGFAYERRDLCCIPERKADSNGGTFGKVLIAAGSAGMCGAAYLSALTAYRAGAGLVKILTVEENRPILPGIASRGDHSDIYTRSAPSGPGRV